MSTKRLAWRVFTGTAAFALVLFGGTASVDAVTIKVVFAGTLEFVDPSLPPGFSPGDSLEGSFTYDTEAPGTIPFEGTRFFPVAGSATIGDFEFSFGGPKGLFFFQDELFPITDVVGVQAPAAGGNPDGPQPLAFEVLLAEGEVFTSIANPPLDPLPLTPGLGFVLFFDDFFAVNGRTTSLQVRSESAGVPDVDNSLLLLGLGLAALSCARGRSTERPIGLGNG